MTIRQLDLYDLYDLYEDASETELKFVKTEKIHETLNSAKSAFCEQRIVGRILPSSHASSALTDCLIVMIVIFVKCHIKSEFFALRRLVWEIVCLCAKIVLA